MKETGITRGLDSLGRIVIPIEIRRLFEIKESDQLEFYVEDNKIILQKSNPSCTFCGSEESLVPFAEKYICSSCVGKIKA
jgi:transcriptional pleiotropic regulator of transition state genes